MPDMLWRCTLYAVHCAMHCTLCTAAPEMLSDSAQVFGRRRRRGARRAAGRRQPEVRRHGGRHDGRRGARLARAFLRGAAGEARRAVGRQRGRQRGDPRQQHQDGANVPRRRPRRGGAAQQGQVGRRRHGRALLRPRRWAADDRALRRHQRWKMRAAGTALHDAQYVTQSF